MPPYVQFSLHVALLSSNECPFLVPYTLLRKGTVLPNAAKWLLPSELGNARPEASLALRAWREPVELADEVAVTLGRAQHEPVRSPHSQHRLQQLVVECLAQSALDVLGAEVREAHALALTHLQHVLQHIQ